MKFLVINPGSTSTKIAVFENNHAKYEENIIHTVDELKPYKHINDQMSYRKDLIEKHLLLWKIEGSKLDAIIGRGGLLPPVKAGAYEINEQMIKVLLSKETVEHASNLAALIAFELSNEFGLKSYIYDSVAVDQLEDVARLSGSPLIPRTSFTHALNTRAMAHAHALACGKTYEQMNFIVAHLGGGISVNAHKKGRLIDVIPDDEGTFSPERAGRVPCNALMELCYSGRFDKQDLKKQMRGKGGIVAYLGTNDVKSVVEKAEAGDQSCELVLDAMTYQVAKSIGEMATVLEGDIDAIILTGGIAYSKYVTERIKKRVAFLADTVIMPGEHEMKALAEGVGRAIRGDEEIHQFI